MRVVEAQGVEHRQQRHLAAADFQVEKPFLGVELVVVRAALAVQGVDMRVQLTVFLATNEGAKTASKAPLS